MPLVVTNEGVVSVLELARSTSFGIAHLATAYRLTTEIYAICYYVVALFFEGSVSVTYPEVSLQILCREVEELARSSPGRVEQYKLQWRFSQCFIRPL